MNDMTIRVLVIDDEPLARSELKDMLSRYKDIRVEGEAESASEAEQLIEETKPALIFLDIQMETKRAGLSLAKSLTMLSMPPYVIFVTAYPEYALEGYQYEPMHYILKPIEDQMLEEAIKRARKLLNQCDSSKMEIREIVLIQKVKDSNTAEVYLYGGQVLEGVNETLREF
ncbi:MAG: response regulator [Pseudomonadota bacterium]